MNESRIGRQQTQIDINRFSREIQTEVDEEQQTEQLQTTADSDNRFPSRCKQTRITRQYSMQNEAKPDDTKRMQSRM
ncbi:hypothetical protein Tco_1303971 [Tanacetum coccineum]